jgi:hypothetical protein
VQIFHSSSYPKDCRVVVQGLNMERGRQDSIKRHHTIGKVLQQNGTSSGALTGALGFAFSATSMTRKGVDE